MPNDNRIRGLFERLRPQLQRLEDRRRSLRNTIIGGVVLAALGVGSCATAFDPPFGLAQLPFWRQGPLAFALLSLACFGLAFVRFLVPGVTGYVNYRARFKKEVVAEVVRAVQPAARYYPDRHLKQEVYAQSRLFRTRLDSFRGDDLLQGVAGDTPFECSELETSYTTGTGKNRTTHSVFSGLFFRIDLDRQLGGHTVVQPPQAPGGDREGMQRVAIDDVFEKSFEVWSTHPEEAHSLLDAAARERLLDLADSVGSVHFAFAGRTAYAAVGYRRRLFEPSLAGALDEAGLAALAAPLGTADAVVRALGLDGRRRLPADPGFHSGGFAVGGMEAVAGRIVAEGDIGIEGLAEAAAAETAAAPAPAPARPFSQLTDTGFGLEVRYPFAFGTLFTLVMFLVLTPVVLATGANWASPSLGQELLGRVAERWPQARVAVAGLFASPTATLLGSLLFWWYFGSWVRYRPALLSIGPEGATLRRMFHPFALQLPLSVIRRVDASNRQVNLVRADRSLLRSMVMVTPYLPSEAEARWLAAQLRAALKRSGWRPAPSRSQPASA